MNIVLVLPIIARAITRNGYANVNADVYKPGRDLRRRVYKVSNISGLVIVSGSLGLISSLYDPVRHSSPTTLSFQTIYISTPDLLSRIFFWKKSRWKFILLFSVIISLYCCCRVWVFDESFSAAKTILLKFSFEGKQLGNCFVHKFLSCWFLSGICTPLVAHVYVIEQWLICIFGSVVYYRLGVVLRV